MPAPFLNKNKSSNAGWAYAGIGFEFVGMFLACTAFGWWLDSLFWPTRHWAMLAGLFLGFFASLLHVLLRTREIEAQDQQNDLLIQDQTPIETNSEKIARLESEVEEVSERLEEFFDERERKPGQK